MTDTPTTDTTSNEFDPNSFDPFSPEVKLAPEVHYAKMRAMCPVHHHSFTPQQLSDFNENDTRLSSGGGEVTEIYSLFKHNDVSALYLDNENFLNREGSGPERMKPDPNPVLVWSDGAAHARSRKIALSVFSPRVIRPLAPLIQARVDSLIDGFEQAGTIDVMDDFALPTTSKMLIDLLGLDPALTDQVVGWGQGIMDIQGGDLDAKRRGQEAIDELSQLVSELIPSRLAAVERGDGATDAITQLLTTLDDTGNRLSDEELDLVVLQLIGAGFETSALAITSGVQLLCSNPSEKQKLIERPELITNAVEEILRCMGSAEGTFRTAARDIDFAGVHLAEGTKVRAVITSANRDEEVFTDADRFDIERSKSELRQHVAFGRGVHACIGNALARQELLIAIGTLFRRIPDLELDPAVPPVRTQNLATNGFASVRVVWNPTKVLSRTSS